MAFGTLSMTDLLIVNSTSVIDYGEDKIFDIFQTYLTIHNRLLAEKTDALVYPTNARLLRYGVQSTMQFEKVDEFGTVDAQKVVPSGYTVGFPLEAYAVALQWTRRYFQQHTPAELAIQFTAIQDADAMNLDRQIRQTLFTPTNYTFTDRLTAVAQDQIDLPVKALLNADGQPIPPDQWGNTFDGNTHTHYMFTAALVVGDIKALIQNVIEHHPVGKVVIWINLAQEAAVRLMTPDFVPYLDARLNPGSGITTANGSLDMMNTQDRAIGILGAAEIWVKSWVPAGYMFCYVQGAPRPIAWRRPVGPGASLELLFDDEAYPLRAQSFGREFGLGIWTRTNGAILYIGGGAYVTPTFT
jgi:hypothetical protein